MHSDGGGGGRILTVTVFPTTPAAPLRTLWCTTPSVCHQKIGIALLYSYDMKYCRLCSHSKRVYA